MEYTILFCGFGGIIMLIEFATYTKKDDIYDRLTFSVMEYKYINKYLDKDKYIFIALRDTHANYTVSFTRLEQYLQDTKNEYRKGETIGNKAMNVCQMLNYLFIKTRKANAISDITWDMLNEFFEFYINEKDDTGNRIRGKKDTLRRCMKDVVLFMKNYIKANSSKAKFKISVDDLFYDKIVYDIKNGGYKEVISPSFSDKFPDDTPSKFRDLPEPYYYLLIRVAKEFMPEMVFPLTLQAYAGIREGEVCNLTQGSIKVTEGIGYVSNMELDLTQNAVFEDFPTKNVGTIKVNRKQKIYTTFVDKAYSEYKRYLEELEVISKKKKNIRFELGNKNLPLFYNEWGKPLTASAYAARFNKLFNEYFLPTLYYVAKQKKTNNAIDFAYYEKYKMDYPAAHCLRHWFTMHLVIDGLSEAEIQNWRGDSSPETAKYYYHNQGLLKKKFIETTLTYQNIIWSEILHADK